MSTRLIEYDLLKKIIDKDLEAWLNCLDAVEKSNINTSDAYNKLKNSVKEITASIIINHIGVSINHTIDYHWWNDIVDLLEYAQGNPDEYKDKIYDMVLNIYRESVDSKITKLEEMVTEYTCLLGSLPDEDDNRS